MSDSKHDDTLPPAIGEALKQVHEPPATPREEMWQAIQSQRQERKIVGRISALPTSLRLLVAAAAILLVGFFGGRLWENSNMTPEPSVNNATAPTANETVGDGPAPTAVAIDASLGESATSTTAAPNALNQAQLLHAANHFTRSGVLLAQFAESVSDDDPLDPELHSWASDLLANTRLLLDSPLAADPQYRKLLRDLEFTLAQIVQTSAA